MKKSLLLPLAFCCAAFSLLSGFSVQEGGIEARTADTERGIGVVQEYNQNLKTENKDMEPVLLADSAFDKCCSNLKNIAVACEMFACDHGGLYPRSLSELVPNYLKRIPVCPTAGRDTYSASYRTSYDSDYFWVCCQGCYHNCENSPYYDAVKGLGLKIRVRR